MSKKAAWLSVLMCLCFLSQPFQNVYADELVEPVEIEPIQIALPPEVSQEQEVVAEIFVPENDVEIVIETIEPSLNNNEQTVPLVVSGSTSISTTDSLSDDPGSDVVENTNTTTDFASDIISATSTESIITTDATDNAGEVDDEVVPEEVIEENTQSDSEENDLNTDEVINGVTEIDELPATNDNLVSIVKSDSAFEFSKSECTRIQDGSFYCQKNEGNNIVEDSLIAAPDADGDLEIYLIRDGVKTQITNNTVDDASPYYDEYSKTIVWHRLVNDRYQVISYEIKTGKETQLTSTSVNNMQPTRHGEYTVWQRWVDNNWEVILFDGVKEKQITDSPRHDIAPHVRGPLVIWNSRSNDGTQSLMTYDIKDRTYTTIADGEGVSVSNPRMVVMYEAMYENGDTIMKGFDLVSGEIVPLHALPKQLPDELPNTDSTGETRALIQSKTSLKQTEVVSNSTPTGSGTPPIISDLPDGNTLDLRSTTTPDMSFDKIPEVIATSSIPDLILPPTSLPEDIENIATSSQIVSE